MNFLGDAYPLAYPPDLHHMHWVSVASVINWAALDKITSLRIKKIVTLIQALHQWSTLPAHSNSKHTENTLACTHTLACLSALCLLVKIDCMANLWLLGSHHNWWSQWWNVYARVVCRNFKLNAIFYTRILSCMP